MISITVAILSCRERERSNGAGELQPMAAPANTVSPTPAEFVQIETKPPKPEPRTRATVLVRFSDASPELQPISRKPVHLIAVSRDLSWMKHLHPRGSGSMYSTDVRFPEAGEYVLFTMFQRSGWERSVVSSRVFAGSLVDQHAAARTAVTPLTTKVGTYAVELVMPAPPHAGSWSALKFRITKTGSPVTNLVAADSLGDLIIVREGGLDFVYSHSTEGEAAGGMRGRLHAPLKPPALTPGEKGTKVTYFGPDVGFHTRFPVAGRYRLSLEVAAGDDPITADFVIDVLPPPAASHEPH